MTSPISVSHETKRGRPPGLVTGSLRSRAKDLEIHPVRLWRYQVARRVWTMHPWLDDWELNWPGKTWSLNACLRYWHDVHSWTLPAPVSIDHWVALLNSRIYRGRKIDPDLPAWTTPFDPDIRMAFGSWAKKTGGVLHRRDSWGDEPQDQRGAPSA